MLTPSRTGLLVIGHGSKRTPASIRPAQQVADALRDGGWADVQVGALRTEPGIAAAARACAGETLLVLPVALADGWFSATAVPEAVRKADPRAGVLSRATGTHPSFRSVALERYRAACDEVGWDPADSYLLLVAHGTPRSSASGAGAAEAAAAARAAGVATSVAFLDDDPLASDAADRLSHQQIVVVPWFLADGAHPRWDLPELMGIEREPAFHTPIGRGRASVVFTSAVGMDDALTAAARARVDELLADPRTALSHWERDPADR